MYYFVPRSEIDTLVQYHSQKILEFEKMAGRYQKNSRNAKEKYDAPDRQALIRLDVDVLILYRDAVASLATGEVKYSEIS